jgi:cytoskeletal protein RodZ
MKTGKESLSFGRYLQSIRLEKKISLEKVAAETRIGMGNLLLIEKEDLEALPAEVFVRGFLRAYARAIGADPAEAIRLYQAKLNMESKLADAGKFSGRSSIKLWRHLVLSVAALSAVIVLSIYGVSYLQSQARMHETDAARESSEHPKETLPQAPQGSVAQKGSNPKTPEKLVLHLAAIEDTWIKVIVDNKDSKEYNLKSGENLEMEASVGYNLLVGNARGVELKLNEKPIPISGKNGEVVNIQLP